MEYKDIYTHVTEGGFGLYTVEHPEAMCGIQRISEGIRYALDGEDGALFLNDVKAAASSFFSGNYGTFYEDDEKPITGHEFGEYRSIYGPIHAHMDAGIVVVYFPFER